MDDPISHQGSFDEGHYQSKIFYDGGLVRVIDSSDALRSTSEGAQIWEARIKDKIDSDGNILSRDYIYFARNGAYVPNTGPDHPAKVRKEQDDFAKKVLEDYIASH